MLMIAYMSTKSLPAIMLAHAAVDFIDFARAPIVDPSAFYEVDLFVHPSIRTFSHNLDPERSFAEC